MTETGASACPACGSSRGRHAFNGKDIRLSTTTDEFPLRECLECTSLFLDPPPKAEDTLRYYRDGYWWKDSSGGLIPRAIERYRRFVLGSHASLVLQAIRNLGKSLAEAKVLDMGAGGTRLAHLLARKGLLVTSLDISPRAFEAAPQDERIETIVAPAERTGLKDSSFDLVTLFHSLEHAVDPAAVLREAHRILIPAGRIIVEVPNSESFECRLAGSRWYGLDVPRHAVSFSRQGLMLLLSRSGFKPGKVRHFCLRDAGPSLVSSFLLPLDPSRRRAAGPPAEKPGMLLPVWGDVLYFLLVVLSAPLALLEAAAGRGGTVTVEAEKEEGP